MTYRTAARMMQKSFYQTFKKLIYWNRRKYAFLLKHLNSTFHTYTLEITFLNSSIPVPGEKTALISLETWMNDKWPVANVCRKK